MAEAQKEMAVQFTRMCKFWRKNECKMGADCTFAHSTSELRPSPKRCFEFVKNGGYCTRGHACRFAHHVVESKKPRFAEMQHSTFPSFQAQEDAFLATYMMPKYPQKGPLSPMGVAETRQFGPPRTFSGQVIHSCDQWPSVNPPGPDKIPLPMSLMGDFEHKVDKPANAESRSSSLSEASLGMDYFPFSFAKNMAVGEMKQVARPR